MFEWIEENGIKWIKDDNGNRCSVEYFGSEEAAEQALKSLVRCKNCINCSDCFASWGCDRCSDCDCCYRCSNCFGCQDCDGLGNERGKNSIKPSYTVPVGY